MSDRLHAQSVFHGAVVLFIGLVAGLPFGAAVGHSPTADTAHAWRVAHAGNTAIGVMLITIGAVAPRLVLGRRLAALMIWALIGAAYSFVLATVAAALAGERGLAMKGSVINRAIFVGYLFGVGAAFLGVVLLIAGAYAAFTKASTAAK